MADRHGDEQFENETAGSRAATAEVDPGFEEPEPTNTFDVTKSTEWWAVSDDMKPSLDIGTQVVLHNLTILGKELSDLRNYIDAKFKVAFRSRSGSAEVQRGELELLKESDLVIASHTNVLLDGLRTFISKSKDNRAYLTKSANTQAMAKKFQQDLLSQDMFVDNEDESMEEGNPAAEIKEHFSKLKDRSMTSFYVTLCKLLKKTDEPSTDPQGAPTAARRKRRAPEMGDGDEHNGEEARPASGDEGENGQQGSSSDRGRRAKRTAGRGSEGVGRGTGRGSRI